MCHLHQSELSVGPCCQIVESRFDDFRSATSNGTVVHCCVSILEDIWKDFCERGKFFQDATQPNWFCKTPHFLHIWDSKIEYGACVKLQCCWFTTRSEAKINFDSFVLIGQSRTITVQHIKRTKLFYIENRRLLLHPVYYIVLPFFQFSEYFSLNCSITDIIHVYCSCRRPRQALHRNPYPLKRTKVVLGSSGRRQITATICL